MNFNELSQCVISAWQKNGLFMFLLASEVLKSYDKQRHIDGSVQDCSNSSALAMDLLQSCAQPSIYANTLYTDSLYQKHVILCHLVFLL